MTSDPDLYRDPSEADAFCDLHLTGPIDTHRVVLLCTDKSSATVCADAMGGSLLRR